MSSIVFAFNTEAQKSVITEITEIIENQLNESWDELITTNEFGTKTKIKAFGRIISHTAYHTGQVALLLKYGNLN